MSIASASRPQIGRLTELRHGVAAAVAAWLLQPTDGFPQAPDVQGQPEQTSAAAAQPPPPFTGPELAIGSPTAPVVVVEYLSVTCSHCAAFDRDVWPEIKRRYVDTGRVQFLIREMPTAPVAYAAAGFLLARCTGEARYFAAVEIMLQNQPYILAAPNAGEAVRREAELIGMPAKRAGACLTDVGAIETLNDRREAGRSAGIESTPTFVILNPIGTGLRAVPDRPASAAGELSLHEFESFLHLRDLPLRPVPTHQPAR